MPNGATHPWVTEARGPACYGSGLLSPPSLLSVIGRALGFRPQARPLAVVAPREIDSTV